MKQEVGVEMQDDSEYQIEIDYDKRYHGNLSIVSNGVQRVLQDLIIAGHLNFKIASCEAAEKEGRINYVFKFSNVGE